jgi:hypothetical protein
VLSGTRRRDVAVSYKQTIKNPSVTYYNHIDGYITGHAGDISRNTISDALVSVVLPPTRMMIVVGMLHQ